MVIPTFAEKKKEEEIKKEIIANYSKLNITEYLDYYKLYRNFAIEKKENELYISNFFKICPICKSEMKIVSYHAICTNCKLEVSMSCRINCPLKENDNINYIRLNNDLKILFKNIHIRKIAQIIVEHSGIYDCGMRHALTQLIKIDKKIDKKYLRRSDNQIENLEVQYNPFQESFLGSIQKNALCPICEKRFNKREDSYSRTTFKCDKCGCFLNIKKDMINKNFRNLVREKLDQRFFPLNPLLESLCVDYVYFPMVKSIRFKWNDSKRHLLNLVIRLNIELNDLSKCKISI